MSRATVEIELDGEGKIELVPSLAALNHLNGKYDNMQAVIGRLSSLDMRVYSEVVYAGLLHTEKHGNKVKIGELEEAIYSTGMVILMPKLIEFVAVILNGGKKIEDSDGKETTSNPEA